MVNIFSGGLSLQHNFSGGLSFQHNFSGGGLDETLVMIPDPSALIIFYQTKHRINCIIYVKKITFIIGINTFVTVRL